VSEKERPDPDGTEMVDLGDVDVSAVDLPASTPGRDRSVPPPLPPEVRASAPPPSMSMHGSMPPPPRSSKFYVMLIVGFVAVGVIVGVALAFGTRGEKKTVIVTTSASPSPPATGSVMTLPTIDMNDDEGDGGK
jgi:hypothetical protein